jgi:hypothetical protein
MDGGKERKRSSELRIDFISYQLSLELKVLTSAMFAGACIWHWCENAPIARERCDGAREPLPLKTPGQVTVRASFLLCAEIPFAAF